MKWLKRSIWLAAWGVWLALGVGLHRELPRAPGELIVPLPNGSKEFMVGFVDHAPRLLACSHDWNAAGQELWIWDAASRTAAKRLFADLPTVPWHSASPRRDFAVIAERFMPGPLAWSGCFAIHLRTGERRPLPVKGYAPVYHPTRPWAIFTALAEEPNGPAWVKAFDLRTGRLFFEWRGAPGALKNNPFFIGDDRIGVPLKATRTEPSTLEVWTLPQAAAPAQRVAPFDIGNDAVVSPTGRIAWNRNDVTVEVFDVAAERSAFTEPPKSDAARARPTTDVVGRPLLSNDGAAVLASVSGALFEIATGKTLWLARADESIVGHLDDRRFEVRERWTVDVGRWSKSFETFAVRDLRDGRFVYRAWSPTLTVYAEDDEGRAFSLTDEGVRTLPPQVDWLVLSFCQAILASPLILLWAILRWRRKRQLRAEASP
jgi:hypothetical protein